MIEEKILSETVDVGLTSSPNFNVIGHLEGANRSYLKYIEDETHCKLSVNGAINPGFESEIDGPITITIVGDREEDINKAKELVDNLIQTVKAQKEKSIQQKAAKRSKRKKNQAKNVDLPTQLLVAMKYFYPGPPADPPPPGSTADLKIHKKYFRQVGTKEKWFLM